MITQAHQDHPELSIQRLCELFGMNRSWYYEAQQERVDEKETALRDEIERLILEFPGYGYRHVTKALGDATVFCNQPARPAVNERATDRGQTVGLGHMNQTRVPASTMTLR